MRTPNGSGQARGPAAPAEAPGPNRHGLDGSPDGGWRGWWNPESMGAAARHSDREPVDTGRLDGTGGSNGWHVPDQHHPMTPERQALPAALKPSPTPRAPEPGPAEADIPTPRPAGEASTGNRNGGRPELRRRVPQAHLAPELRQPTADEPSAALPPTAPRPSALSRYQASRQAAQAVVDETGAGGVRT